MWPLFRRIVLLAMGAVAVWVLVQRESDLRGAARILSRLDWRWVGLAVLFEAASMLVFARLQRWLLRAGGVRLPLATMVEITLAENAISATLPGGVAWAAAWAFGQLRRRGVDRFVRLWVFMVAGAVSSFALFVVVAGGVELAGAKGPVADLRWAAVGLAAIPVVALAIAGFRRWRMVRVVEDRLYAWGLSHLSDERILRSVRSLVARLQTVHLSPLQWAWVMGLALLNWLYDGCVLVCSLLALHVPVPWRDVFVIYGITQIAASFPVTPGGLGVVEASLAALLSAYGVETGAALATVVVYRLVSFWGLVPVGWAVWAALQFMDRSRRRTGPHPWTRRKC